MPVVLTRLDEVDIWLTAPPAVALQLQRPLAGGSLRIVAVGEKKDEASLIAQWARIDCHDAH
jgi:putative SOS response-associated peptidase YedK